MEFIDDIQIAPGEWIILAGLIVLLFLFSFMISKVFSRKRDRIPDHGNKKNY
tara:strand:+ start:101 stop:256 length:156 start_codon:yes stop_codon:yes gene_type:complete